MDSYLMVNNPVAPIHDVTWEQQAGILHLLPLIIIIVVVVAGAR
jgi:hypothetical protein